MIKRILISVAVLLAVTCGIATAQKKSDVYEARTAPRISNQIDKIVFEKLRSMGIQPVLCSDEVFVRRAYLDLIGKIPTAEEAVRFLDEKSSQKRKTLIDELMERDEFADYWSMRWGDVLRIKAEFPINLWPNAAQAYHRWVRAAIVANMPYDQFAREMLTSSGSNFRVGPVNFYRAVQNKTPEGIATVVALTFMGARAENWPEGRLAGMAVFFSQIGYKPTNEWKEENVFWDPLQTTSVKGNAASGAASIDAVITGKVSQASTVLPAGFGEQEAMFPDGKKIQLPPNRDPRHIFANWLITPNNPWFTKSIVNRTWGWFLGRGIIHEPDDMREDNPPSIPQLLDYLEKEMVSSGYDMNHLFKLILTSSTYQLSSTSNFKDPKAVANFASYQIRRLDAEVLIDAINQITGTTDLYTSAIPEPFTYIPKDMPAVAIADGSISSSFLTLFGRSARATGTANERDNDPQFAQWLHMLNSGHIQEKLERGPKLRAITNSKRKPEEMTNQLYLTFLSRYPTDEEMKMVMEYGGFNAEATVSADTKAKQASSQSKKSAKRKPKKYSQMTAKEKAAFQAEKARIAKMTPEQKAAEKKKQDTALAKAKKAKLAAAQKAKAVAKKRAATAKAASTAKRDSWNDIAWMLANSPEFLYRH